MENKRNKTRNVISQHQLQNLTKDLQDSSDNPILISIDQEGGKVNRLKKRYGFPDFPSWNEIGFIDDVQNTKEYSELLGNCLNDIGINLNYAPVLDLDYGESSYIGNANRALSKDPNKVINHSSIFISELKKKTVKELRIQPTYTPRLFSKLSFPKKPIMQSILSISPKFNLNWLNAYTSPKIWPTNIFLKLIFVRLPSFY